MKNKAIQTLSAIGTKTYHVGDNVDISDIKVIATLKDGTSVQIPIEACNVLPKIFTNLLKFADIVYRGDEDPVLICRVEGIEVLD